MKLDFIHKIMIIDQKERILRDFELFSTEGNLRSIFIDKILLFSTVDHFLKLQKKHPKFISGVETV